MRAAFLRYGFILLTFFPWLSALGDNDGLQFVENKGQFDAKVLFRVQLNSGYIFLEKNAITFKLFNEEQYFEAHKHLHREPSKSDGTIKGHVFKYEFVNTSTNKTIRGMLPCHEKFNYFLGKDKSKWASHVSVYNEVVYHNIYSGIDLRVYSKYGQLKYEWIVSPYAEPSQILINVVGLSNINIKNNSILLKTSIGELTDKNLLVWQTSNPKQDVASNFVECRYLLDKNQIRYQFPKGYDASKHLVIDPILIFSTYSGSRGDNFGYTATFDLRGHLYAGGITDNTHGEYPVTTGAFQTVCKGGQGFDPVNLPCDITISKYDSSGRTLLYATYIGGSEDDYPHSMVVNGDTELVVFGTSYSRDFPMHDNGYDTSHNSYSSTAFFTDLVIFKLSVNGDKLTGATFFGGSNHDGLTDDDLKYNYADDFRGEVLTDKSNNIYVVTSTNSKDIPLKNESKSSLEGNADGLCLKFSTGLDQLLWSTYFGGNGSDGIYSLEFDKNENVYIAGGTTSNNLATHSTAFGKNYHGDTDGFLAVFDKTTFALDKATYYGTSAYDQVYFLEIDKAGNVYGTGQTEGNIKASAGAYRNKANTGQFIFIADAGLSKIIKQTVFGARTNNPEISPSAFLVDSCGNIYISGWGSTITRNGTTAGLPITNNALQKTTDNNDFYLAVFGKNLYSLLFATYYGGNRSEDHVDGGTSRFDKRGVIYQSVCSSCPDRPGATISDFPTTSNSAFPKNVSWRCSNAAFKIDFQISNIVKARFIPDQTVCGPADIQFTNLSSGGDYYWDFGDGKKSTAMDPLHSFANKGQYKISLVAVDSNTCNVSDTFIKLVNILQKPVADFEIKNVPCTETVDITNKSKLNITTDWDFGDGITSKNPNPGTHTYLTPGTYKIRLITDVANLCSDTAWQTVFIRNNTFVTAGFTPDTTACSPAEVQFLNQSSGTSKYAWDFGDGTTSDLRDPKHIFTKDGVFTVRLITTDSTTCNVNDTAFRTVTIIKRSLAEFSIKEFECSSKIEIENKSKDHSSSDWDFGDNTTDERDQPGFHEYKTKGDFTIRLITNKNNACPDTALVNLTIVGTPEDIIKPVNVFTPDGDGLNDCFHFGGVLNECSEIKITIFNRWGQKVFETKDFKQCWNGKVNNIKGDCPEGTYLYICEYKGSAEKMKPLFSGTVTLIRGAEK